MEPAQEAPPTGKKIGIVSMKDKGQRTRDEGTEDRKQRSKHRNSGIEPQKGDTGTVDRGQGMEKGGWETGNRLCETGYRGRDTRSRAVRQGIEDGVQGSET